MTVQELIKDLRLCANRTISCYGCTNYNSCTLGDVEVKDKNRSMLLENSADMIEAFIELLDRFDIDIKTFYPYEINQAFCDQCMSAIYEACEGNNYERNDVEWYN